MIRTLCLLFLSSSLPLSAATSVLFDPGSPDAGPFPSDVYTVADRAQKTGRRVNLPLPDCLVQASTCNELNLINQLDGFSVTARLTVRFSAAIDTSTVAGGVYFVALDNLTQDEKGIHQPGDIVKINKVVYDPATNTLYAKPDAVLDQHRHYAVVVTDAVKDSTGAAVTAAPAFAACASSPGGEYCTALQAVIGTLTAAAAPAQIVAASLFTTQSATAWLESVRSQLDQVPPVPVIAMAPLKIAEMDTIALNQQTGIQPTQLSSFVIPIASLSSVIQGLGSIAIGSFTSPSFLDATRTIQPAATGSPVTMPTATNQVYFNALLPDSTKPSAGYPVVIFGHGFGDSRFGGPTAVSAKFATAGFATLAINAAGHGYGPESTVTFTDKSGHATMLTSGGRSVDYNGDGTIEANEGCAIMTPVAIGLRDCFRQTAVDLMQLVRAIRAGIDLDGDGAADLDPNRIYYSGQSLGAIYGTIISALEPGIRAAALNVGGASLDDIARLSTSYKDLNALALGSRTPSLLNDGTAYNEDYVLRDQPVKTVAVNGALPIQSYFETIDWLSNQGDPIAFAPHLKTSPLAQGTAKQVLFQFALGDRTVPNPTNSALIRAAGMPENAWMYRHDRARAVLTDLPVNPHPFLVLFVSLDGNTLKLPSTLGLVISSLAQQQIAGFFTADGVTIPNPNNYLITALLGGALFEVPTQLPETPGF
jgi:hypothetical protein